MIEIVHRPLTQAEAQTLHEELKTTPNILGYTVRELRRLSDVYVAETNGVFEGVCFSIDLTQGWTEIAALYVLPKFRGHGLGKKLFHAAWDGCLKRRRHVYVLSRNSQVIGWMRELGMMVTASTWHTPLAVHWYMGWYMASRHRIVASLRKHRQIAACPALMQGIKKYG